MHQLKSKTHLCSELAFAINKSIKIAYLKGYRTETRSSSGPALYTFSKVVYKAIVEKIVNKMYRIKQD